MSEYTCGQCKFVDKRETAYGGYSFRCGWQPPRVAGLRPWGGNNPQLSEDTEACSVFSPAPVPSKVQPGAPMQRIVRLEDDA